MSKAYHYYHMDHFLQKFAVMNFRDTQIAKFFAGISFPEWPVNYNFAGIRFYERPKKSRNRKKFRPAKVSTFKVVDTQKPYNCIHVYVFGAFC